jgi:DNA polymerase-3 subunit delta
LRFFLLNKDVQEKDLVPCYFLFGEETFLAREFLGQLKDLLISPDAQDFNLERFHLEDTTWREVIDLARTAPFMFSPYRLIYLELSSAEKKEREGSEKKGEKFFSDMDETLVRAYLTAPGAKTVLVVVLPGKPSYSRRVMKFFTSFPPSIVMAVELKPLKKDGLGTWLDRRASACGKSISRPAKDKLAELVGSDLQRLDQEIDKLAVFVGDKKAIDEEDVDLASGGTRDLEGWELDNALEGRDAKKCLAVLANLFGGGGAPEYVLGIVSNFFRGVLAAQDGLREGRDKKEIFRALKPQIRESYGRWYFDRLNDFFSLVEGFSGRELDDLLQSLGRIDVRLKTTDVSPRVELEAFVVDYCRRRRPDKVTWSPRR